MILYEDIVDQSHKALSYVGFLFTITYEQSLNSSYFFIFLNVTRRRGYLNKNMYNHVQISKYMFLEFYIVYYLPKTTVTKVQVYIILQVKILYHVAPS